MSVWRSVERRGQLSALSGLCLLLGMASGHAAPAQQMQDLEARISAAQSRENTLAQRVNDISAGSGTVQLAQLFGESDEDKAARLQHEQAQDSSITMLNQRVGDVEESLRRLTGQVEQLDHRLGELGERMTRMQKDFDYKLCALAAQQLGASNQGGGEEDTLPCNGSGQQTGLGAPPAYGGTPPQAASREPIHLAPPPGVLGTLSRNDVANAPTPNEPPPSQMASIDARTQFDSAMNLLTRAQYEEARAAFEGFADAYPQESDLAPRALYWVGDIAYSIQKDYAGAARAFAEELKKYPDNPHAPESMLKLGQSLIALNQKKEGCTALGTLASRYPAASKSISDQALDARKTARCR